MNKYDVVIPITEKNIKLQSIISKRVMMFLPCKRIVYVGPARVRTMVPESQNIVFIDEGELYPGINYELVKKKLISLCGSGDKTGWYLQQFLKICYGLLTEDDYYIVWDSDLIPLNQIKYYDQDDKKFLFTMKIEYHPPYFDTINKLFNGRVSKVCKGSFVAEQMIFNSSYVKAMVNEIKDESTEFWETILEKCDRSQLNIAAFSEFETYGNYVMSTKEMSTSYKYRKLRCCRKGANYIGCMPDEMILKWCAKSLDMISIEQNIDPEGASGLFVKLIKNKMFRLVFSMKTCMLLRKYMARLYRLLKGDHNRYIEFD